MGLGKGETRYGGGAPRGFRGRAPDGTRNLAIYGKKCPAAAAMVCPFGSVYCCINELMIPTGIRAPIEGTGSSQVGAGPQYF